jgi:glutamate carboxypeptidase
LLRFRLKTLEVSAAISVRKFRKKMSQANIILDYLIENRESMVDFLSRLVLAESPSTSPEAQALPLTILWEALDELHYEAKVVPGRESGGYLQAIPKEHVPEIKGSDDGVQPSQLLLGHCDTVWPLGTLKQMPLVVQDNIVRGPGVFDMKGGLTQMIFSLRALRDIGLSAVYVPKVLINSDEEIGSHESLPVILKLARQVKRAFILEPALGLGGKLKTARKGVGRFEIVAHGRAAHAGLDPGKGVSAVLALSYLVQNLHALNDPEKGISVNVGIIEGGLQANVIPPQCRAVVDVRVPTKEDARRLEETIFGLSAANHDIRLEITGRFGRPPLEPTPENQALWRTALRLGAELGTSLDQGIAGGGSDGNYTSLHTATLDGLGAVGDGAHADHEFIFIDKMIERTALLTLLLITP